MFNIFNKQKEKKIKNIENDLNAFLIENEQYFNTITFDGKDIIIYKKAHIKNDEIIISFKKSSTPEGWICNAPLNNFRFKYGDSFIKQHRLTFLNLKQQMNVLGLTLEETTK